MRRVPRDPPRRAGLLHMGLAAWLCSCSLVLPWSGYARPDGPVGDAGATDTATATGPHDAMAADSGPRPVGDAGCGVCTAPASCGGGGVPNQCGCTPTSCPQVGATCGTLADGCGGTLTCGACSGSLICGGGGMANRCGMGPCVPATCASLGDPCGVVSDGCGGTLACASCVAPQTCGGGGMPSRCGCVPTSCGALGAICGTPPDGCGGTLSCGACVAPATCGGGSTPNVCSTPSTCGPLQVAEIGSLQISGSDVVTAASSPTECQQHCDSVPGTLCCVWYLSITLNGVTDPCVAYAESSCTNDWQSIDASSIDAGVGGFVWATACK